MFVSSKCKLLLKRKRKTRLSSVKKRVIRSSLPKDLKLFGHEMLDVTSKDFFFLPKIQVESAGINLSRM